MSNGTSFDAAPVWLITGTSQGLGKALLDGVLASGQRAVATLRKPKVLAEYQRKYQESQLLVTQLDVSDSARIVEVFREVKDKFGRLDVVVNNAGYGIAAEIETTPDEEARKLFEVVFWGMVNISKQAIVFMRDINPPGLGGRILNLSSTTGYSANPVIGFYSAAKFALEGFTEALTKEMLPEWNIKAMIIEPGGFRTEWGRGNLVNYPIPPQYAAPGTPSSVLRKMLYGEMIGDPAKAAQALLRIAKEPNPPLRLQLGSECLMIIREKAKQTLRDNEKWEDLSHSTNLDGYAKEMVLQQFKDAVS